MNKLNFQNFVKVLAQDLWTIAATIELSSSQIPIFWHTYDYPIASGKGIWLGPLGNIGPWIKPALIARNYRDENEMKEVVHAVMQEFSKAQASIIDWMKSGKAHKDIKPNIHLIELKGTVPNSEDWPDEIHPNASSNKRLAAKFKQSIDKKLRD